MKKFGFVFASKMLVEEKRKVRFMYCEPSANPNDSGWRFFCGDEDDAYVSQAMNIGIYDIQTILNLDGSIAPYLNSRPGSAFERVDENDDFVPVGDFSFGEEDE